MKYTLCSPQFIIILSLASPLNISTNIPIIYRESKKTYGSLTIDLTTSKSEPRINVTPYSEELKLLLIQFLFLDKSVRFIQFNNEDGSTRALNRVDYLANWMKHLPTTHISCCLMINEERKVLIGLRAANSFFSGVWEFPGGKLEPGETSISSLVRELKEELNIVVNENDLSYIKSYDYVYPTKRIKLHVFKCYQWSGEIKDIVHDSLQWIEYDHLYRIPMPPADLALLIDFPVLP